MVDAGFFFFFFGKGPYIILFVTPPPHFSLLSKAPVPLCLLSGPVLFSLRQGLLESRLTMSLLCNWGWPWTRTCLRKCWLEWQAIPTTPNSLTYFFENHKYKLNHLHVQKMNVRALYMVILGCLDSTEKVIIVGVLSNIKSTFENICILEQWAREKYLVPSLTNWFK